MSLKDNLLQLTEMLMKFEEYSSRLEKILAMFQENIFQELFEEFDFISDVIIFGSYVKGSNTEKSDIDIIVTPKDIDDFKAQNTDDIVDTVNSITYFLKDGLLVDIPVDLKLNLDNSGSYSGYTRHTDDWVVVQFHLSKEELGEYYYIDSKDNIHG